MKKLSYDTILGIDWFKSTNTIVGWVVCYLELIVGAEKHTLLTLKVNSVANVTL